MSPLFPILTVDRGTAVPSGRLGYRLTDEVLLLHTIQSAEAFKVLLDGGPLFPELSRAPEEFVEAYTWLLARMADRLPTTGDAATWLWANRLRRDLVDQCRRSDPGDVLLTCRIPRERVLLSHFSDWHLVLNRGLGPLEPFPDEIEEQTWNRWTSRSDWIDDRLTEAGARDLPVSRWPPAIRAEVEASWERILDPAYYPPTGECWQATIHHLLPADVVEARILT